MILFVDLLDVIGEPIKRIQVDWEEGPVLPKHVEMTIQVPGVPSQTYRFTFLRLLRGLGSSQAEYVEDPYIHQREYPEEDRPLKRVLQI